VVNGDESEPGTCKDRVLIENDPHQLIEGVLIAGLAVDAHAGYIYIRGEYRYIIEIVEKAIAEAYSKGWLGKNIQGTGFDFDVYTHTGAGSYECGEESALLESLEGKRGQPRLRPPFPAVVGLYGQPTVINNTETMANVPYILNHGAEAYKKLGTEKSPGTKVFCLSGMVKRPANYEAELGKITFRDLIYGEEFGQGMLVEGRQVKAILPSGASGPIVTEAALDVPLDYESLVTAGSILGSASVIVMDDSIDMVWAAGKVMHFFRHESCGKCTPCREGTFWMEKQYHRILGGKATLADVQLLQNVANQIVGKCLCPLGEFATSPVLSSFQHFQAEYESRATDARKPSATPAAAPAKAVAKK